MSLEFYTTRSTEPEAHSVELSFVGNAAASPTNKPFGRGVTVTWVSTGTYDLTFADTPGNLIGLQGFAFLDATPANAAGWTVVGQAYTAATGTTKAKLRVAIYNSTFALANVAATTTLTLLLKMRHGGVNF